MKKLFISCPIKGRTEENIRNSMARMHKMAELFFDQELEVIPTYIEDNPPENSDHAVWRLGESIKKLAEADYFIGIKYTEAFRGCYVESEVVRLYNIPCFLVDLDMMPDALAIDNEYWNDQRALEG